MTHEQEAWSGIFIPIGVVVGCLVLGTYFYFFRDILDPKLFLKFIFYVLFPFGILVRIAHRNAKLIRKKLKKHFKTVAKNFYIVLILLNGFMSGLFLILFISIFVLLFI